MAHDVAAQYIRSLDGLRACAAIVVLMFHARMPYTGGGSIIGVGAFFVLSGFLITRLIADEHARSGRFDYPGFQARRLARLAPLIMFFCVIFVAFEPLLYPQVKVWREVLPTLFYYSDFSVFLVKQPDFLRHMWSLAVEMQFYLIWPLVVITALRFSGRHFATSLLVVFLLLLAWRFLLRHSFDAGFMRSYYSLDNAAASLAIGGWLCAARIQLGKAQANLAALTAVVIYAPILVQTWETVQAYNTLFLTLNDFATAAVILSLLCRDSVPARLLSGRIPVSLGLWSYGIYVWHYPIARLLRDELPGAVSTLVVLIISVGLAALSYRYVEKPARRFLQAHIAIWREPAARANAAQSQRSAS